MARRKQLENEGSWQDLRKKLDWILSLSLITTLISAGGYFVGAAEEANVRLSHDENVQSWYQAQHTWRDIRTSLLQVDAGVVPEDLSILLDDAERYFGSELGLALQDALTIGADLPTSANFGSLTEGQSRDAEYMRDALHRAENLIDAEIAVRWESLPPEAKDALNRSRLLVSGSIGVMMASGLLALFSGLQKRQL